MKWEDLTMREKAAMMKVAIRNGIYDLNTIRHKFDEGGEINKKQEEYTKFVSENIPGLTQKDIEIIRKSRTNTPSLNELSKGKTKSTKTNSNREVEIVMNALKSQANTFNNLGNNYRKAQNRQEESSKEEWKKYKKGVEATATAAELLSSMYMLGKGAKALNWLPNNNVINGIYQSDKGQVIANTLGTIADSYQLLNADNKDIIENSIELPADVAGIVGGTNWFRNSTLFNRYGTTIDNTLDALSYGAAAYDGVIKPFEWIYNQFEE